MTADYLRAQAATCLIWARECFDLGTATRLRLMAEEFSAKAAEIDATHKQEIVFDTSIAPPHPATLQAGGDAS
jgi:hypothetical protein